MMKIRYCMPTYFFCAVLMLFVSIGCNDKSQDATPPESTDISASESPESTELPAAEALPDMAAAQSYEPPVHNLPQAVQGHVDLSYLLLNGAVSPNHLAALCRFGADAGPPTGERIYKTMRPTKAFDQLYVVGVTSADVTKSVQAVALDTSDGIILWDALNGPQDGPDVIEPSMRELGLDPARIKYIVITHHHGDHIGCAKYLQEKYHARVLAAESEWDLMYNNPRPNYFPPPPPARDMVITDGMTLTLGESTVTFYITPGHTPESVSSIIPVTDYGEPHVLAYWGGTGPPGNIGPIAWNAGLRAYEQSLIRFAKIGIDAHVDGIISNHGCVDGSDYKSLMVENRKQGDPNPWIVGESTVLRFMGSFVEGIRANIANVEIKEAAK